MAMNDLVNRLYEKCGEQASRQKTVGVTQANSKDDANRVIDAQDGQVILANNPNAVNEMRFGGVDQNTLGFTINAQSWASYVQGNIDAIGGLSSAADTVGQEKIIESQSGDRVRAMQTIFVKFMKDVIRGIGHWMWTDPMSSYEFTQQIEGTEIELPVSWPFQIDEFGREVDARQGPFDSYEFDIEPFAMQDLSPEERLQTIRAIWREDVMPLAQMGLQPDIVKYFRMISRYADLPELADILQLPVDTLHAELGGRRSGAGNAPRRYIHENVSRSGGQQAGQDAALALMAGGSA